MQALRRSSKECHANLIANIIHLLHAPELSQFLSCDERETGPLKPRCLHARIIHLLHASELIQLYKYDERETGPLKPRCLHARIASCSRDITINICLYQHPSFRGSLPPTVTCAHVFACVGLLPFDAMPKRGREGRLRLSRRL